MLGQHIFVRCRNEQNNAGTWTAAMTENIVDKDIVRNFIEPRCNMDEAFAQRALMQNDNNVLRIYHVADNVTVVTRTYWVTDRITEAMGRKGAYSISYILTDDEKIRFSGDFSGAFDPSCFESYDALVERIQQNRITINDDFSLFSRGESRFDPSVFRTVGFTKETFVQFMNGLYAALEGGKQLAVILPAPIRRAWEEQGDKTAEKLAYHVMCLLPDFTRMNLGVAAHWSCQIRDKMVSDMHLVFIHPEKEEDAAFLKREGAMLLDLDGGKYTNQIPTIATDYFAFLWDSLEKKEEIEAFWADTKSKYRKLLRGKPNSARAMECAYLMRLVTDADFRNAELVRRTFLLAASEFAGAGTRVAAAEEFLNDAILVMGLEKKPLEPEMETALRLLLVEDPDQTKHQLQEYGLLLRACEQGTAEEETVEGLCDELAKEERNASSYFLAYVSEKKDFPLEKLTLQMVQFVSGLFMRLAVRHSGSSLFRAVFDLMQQWQEGLFAAENVELLKPFMNAYIGYMGSKGDSTEIRAAAYKFLFAFEHKGDTQLREECGKALFREEKKLYKAENETMDGPARIRLYAHSFFDVIPEITKMKKETAVLCYQRLFRLAYKGDPEIVDSALAIYRDALSSAEEGDLLDRIIPVLLQCEEDALEQIAGESIWTPEQVGRVLLMFELMNISGLPRYAPSSKRVGELMKWYNKNVYNTYLVTTYYLRQMQLGDRQVIFKGMQEHGMLENLFLHVLYACDDKELSSAIENYLGKTHADKVTLMLESPLLASSRYEAATVQEVFEGWYAASLKKEMSMLLSSADSARTFQVQNERILQEYRILQIAPDTEAGLKEIAKRILDQTAMDIFSSARAGNAVTLPPEAIREIVRVIGDSSTEEGPKSEDLFRLIEQFDTTIASNDQKKLDEVCYNAYATANKPILRDRLQYYIQKENREDMIRMYWMYYLFLDMQEGIGGPQFRVDQFLHEIGGDGQPDAAQGIVLMNMANSLHWRSSRFEGPYNMAVVNMLAPKIRANPQAFSNEEFLSSWEKVHTLEYFKNTGVRPLLRKMNQNLSLQFDVPMFLMCLISAILTSALACLALWLLVALGRVDMIVTLSVGIFVFIILAVLDFCLLPKRNRRKSGKNRRF